MFSFGLGVISCSNTAAKHNRKYIQTHKQKNIQTQTKRQNNKRNRRNRCKKNSRTIFVEVVDSGTGDPIPGADIRVTDKDAPPFNPNDYMTEGSTDQHGKAKLIYPGRQWDSGSGTRRFPDITLRIRNDGVWS